MFAKPKDIGEDAYDLLAMIVVENRTLRYGSFVIKGKEDDVHYAFLLEDKHGQRATRTVKPDVVEQLMRGHYLRKEREVGKSYHLIVSEYVRRRLQELV